MIRIGIFGIALMAAGSALADGTHEHGIGGPAYAESARVVMIRMTETEDGQMLFDPPSLGFRAGETVRLRIENAGQQEHEFVMDSPSEIADHKQMMAEMPDMVHGSANAIRLQPGDSAELGWTFGEPDSYEFACLILGHYEAGMHGQLTVH